MGLLSIQANGQDGLTPQGLLSHSSVSIYAQEGWHKSNVIPVSGNHQLTPVLTRTWSGSLEISKPFSHKSALVLGAGVGALSWRMYLKEYEEFNAQVIFNNYEPYGKLSLGYAHRFLLPKGKLLTASAHLGRLGLWYRPSGSSTSDNRYDLPFIWSATSSLIAKTSTSYFDVRLKYAGFFKNRDMFGLHVGYRRGFSSVIDLAYITLPETPEESTGLYRHNGSEVYVGMSYMFNRYSKLSKRAKESTHGANSREMKRKWRQEKNETRTNSYRITARVGSSQHRQRMQNPLFYTASDWGWASKNIELELVTEKPKYYWGFLLTRSEYCYKFSGPATTMGGYGFGGNSFSSGQLGGIAGIPIQHKRSGRRFFSLEAGAHLALRDNSDSGYEEWLDGNESKADLYTVDVKRIYPLAHAGIHTTIRLYDQLYWELGAKYYQGFYSVETQEFSYINFYGITGTSTKTVNGSYWVFQTGLSFHISKLKLLK